MPDPLFPSGTDLAHWDIGQNVLEVLACAEDKTLDRMRIADKLELQFTPKHGSWLNMAEIELSV
jgi:hypothetical protein